MANEEKLTQLAERLVGATARGSANWRAESASHFQLSLPSGSVSISSDDADGVEPFTLVVFDDNGTQIETLRSAWAAGRWEREAQPWNEALGELYEAARNSALNIEGVLDNILEDVENPPPPKAADDDDIPF